MPRDDRGKLYQDTIKRAQRAGVYGYANTIIFLAEEIQEYRQKIEELEKHDGVCQANCGEEITLHAEFENECLFASMTDDMRGRIQYVIADPDGKIYVDFNDAG